MPFLATIIVWVVAAMLILKLTGYSPTDVEILSALIVGVSIDAG